MPDLIICDTSCLILFDRINELDLLYKCYENIIITPEIMAEFGHPLPSWITIKEVKNHSTQQALLQILGKGESSAIALSLDFPHATIVIDDLKARKIAKSLKLNITGSLGILVRAKKMGHVNKLKPLLRRMKKADFRVSEVLIKRILLLVGE